MKVKAITICSHESPELTALKQSAERVGIELTVIETVWRGFGTKIIELRKYLQTLDGYTHFVFVDAYDVLFVKYPVIHDYILFSTEKHKWPDTDVPYPETNDVWAYLNSGCYSAPIADFLTLTDKYPVAYEDDDQRYFTNIYLQGGIQLDTNCEVFQSMAFAEPWDFSIDPITNNITGTQPAIIHFNGKCHDKNIYNMVKYSTLNDLKNAWLDTPEVHKEINESFAELVNNAPELKAHRDFVEQNVFGFGERSFQWMWNLIVKEMPEKFTFLEIGVFKGQTLSLIELLARQQLKKAKRYGVTPLSSEGGVWESDYAADIETIHDQFKLNKDYTILHGLSEDKAIIEKASKLKLDILYVDGGHSEIHVYNDINHYSPLVKPGGYMVIDDCCNKFSQPWGYFQGIGSVSKVVDELLPPFAHSNEWTFIASVVHIRIYRRL